MKVQLGQQSIVIRAPRKAVFSLISSFGVDSQTSDTPAIANNQERAKLLERDGNRLLMEFNSTDGRKMYRTVEEVMLYPDERITFRHLEGPLYHSQEEFLFDEVDSELNTGTLMTHNGTIECRMHWLPGVGWAVARFYVKRHYERLVLRHMNNLKVQAESSDTH
ncbi:MAG: SRPBCC family protein [SAR202 cluster bacterium]|nr:SRPBCC family protein [SAR202 cluster bacterium]